MGLVQNRGMWDAYPIRGQQVIKKNSRARLLGIWKALGQPPEVTQKGAFLWINSLLICHPADCHQSPSRKRDARPTWR